MKKLLFLTACAIAIFMSACDAKDGKIDDGKDRRLFPTESIVSNNTGRTNSNNSYNSNKDDGVIHHTASTIGEVGEDIVDGAKNIGSAAASNVSDAFHNDEM